MPWARMEEMGAWKGVVVGDEATKWNVRERNVVGMRVSRGRKLRGGQLSFFCWCGRAYLKMREITSNGKSSRRRLSSILAPFSSPSSPPPQNSSPPWPSGHVTLIDRLLRNHNQAISSSITTFLCSSSYTQSGHIKRASMALAVVNPALGTSFNPLHPFLPHSIETKRETGNEMERNPGDRTEKADYYLYSQRAAVPFFPSSGSSS
jgi:hypothetical protein